MPSQYLEHHGIQIARGDMVRYSSNHKFGAVPAMSQNQTGSIWDINDTLYPWTALDTPAVVNIERNNVADEGLVVTVQGLDSDWNFQEETITIAGADTLGTKLFRRVNRAFCSLNGVTNLGNIDIEAGAAGGTTVARISAGRGQTLMAVYTVPKDYKAYIMQGTATVQDGADASGFMFVRYGGQTVFRIGHSFEVAGDGGQYFYPFATPIEIPEKSDIDVRATVRSNNARVTAAFDMVLFKFRGSL
jgi:hypothetical protein